jgi:hypothetical protein
MTTSKAIKNPALTFDQLRRKLRRELFIKRQADRDNAEARLFNDAQKLDTQLEAEGYTLPYPTEWSRGRATKPHTNRTSSYPQVDVADLFSNGGA